MARLERRRRNPHKFDELLVLINTKIVKIEEKNKEYPNSKKKYKNVFFCESVKSDKPKMCIYWGYSTISEGDEVQLKGRENNGSFVCWSILIIKKGGQSGS